MLWKKDVLFCEISPLTYAISEKKEIFLRHVKNITKGKKFAKTRSKNILPVTIYKMSSGLIKRGKGIDPVLQQNKAVNIDLAGRKMNRLVIMPGEEFSFWYTVGKTTKRRGFKDGRVLEKNSLKPGIGGGLCNLSNTIHNLVLRSPLDVTEFHQHSDALAPDGDHRVPFSSGTSVSYNYIDYRFKNNTDQCFQLLVSVKDEKLFAELRAQHEIPYEYVLEEEGHHFRREGEKFYRVSKIYRLTKDKESGEVLKKELVLDNHSEVMYDYDLIPKELIRE